MFKQWLKYKAKICLCQAFLNNFIKFEIGTQQKVVNHAQEPEEFRHVTPFGIVMAHVDTKLRYTWVLNPHPDFVAADVIGKTDMELAQNDGISDLIALKKRVLESGMADENIINFPLSTGLLSYLVSANAILNIHGQVIGVSTVGVEYSDRGHRKTIRLVSDSKTS